MKRCSFLMVLCLMGSTLFAQVGVSLDGHLATDFTDVAPTIGVEINLNRIDILGEINFWVYNSEKTDTDYETFNTDYTQSQYRVAFFVGIAPKAVLTETWSLTFPLLANIYFRNDALEYESSRTYTEDAAKKIEYFGYGLYLGARTYYALNRRWSLHGGFLFEFFSGRHTTYTYWKTADTTYTRRYDTILWFEQGKFELGVRFKVQ